LCTENIQRGGEFLRPVIALLDLDGVLVLPGGYRAAVDASVHYLVHRMGLDLPDPGPTVPAFFEAVGITSEWDMVPICAAILLNSISEQIKQPLPALHLQDMLEWVQMQNLRGLAIDYAEKICQLGPLIGNGMLPAQNLLSAIQQKIAGSIFPNLLNQPFLTDLLADTRNFTGSLTTMLVQNYVLGSDVFRQTYAIPAQVETESMLEKFDQPALDSALAGRLLRLQEEKKLYLCAYTARPSLPARDSGVLPDQFSPEAEMALRLVGLDGIALIGYGHLEAFSLKNGIHPDLLLKPAPFQPIAAAAAAFTRHEQISLEWANEIIKSKQNGYKQPSGGNLLPAEVDLHIFEDAAIGIQAANKAADILEQVGIRVNLHRWGIAILAEKQAALQKSGACIFPDVNTAMQEAFKDLV
jgi:hypothetical protein